MSDFAAQAVLARLGWGRDNAYTIGSLSEAMGWPRRAVEQAITDLRLQGKAVASGSEGVWIGTAEDMQATAAMLTHRLSIQRKTLDAVEATAHRMEGTQQLPLFKEGEAA